MENLRSPIFSIQEFLKALNLALACEYDLKKIPQSAIRKYSLRTSAYILLLMHRW